MGCCYLWIRIAIVTNTNASAINFVYIKKESYFTC